MKNPTSRCANTTKDVFLPIADYWDLDQQKHHLDWAAWKKQNRLMWPGGIGKSEDGDAFDA